MFDAYQNAKAVERVENKNRQQSKAAIQYLMESEDGRWFLKNLLEICKYDEPISSPEEEGARRVGIMLKRAVIDAGMLDRLHLAEIEYAKYKQEISMMLEQTEAKE